MAYVNTTIADLVPSDKLLSNQVSFAIAAQNEFVNSGVFNTNPMISQYVGAGPRKFTLQYMNPLAADAVNVASDDLNVEGAMGKMTAGEFDACKHVLNYGFATSELASMVTGRDTVSDLTSGISQYWLKTIKDLGVSTLVGLRNSSASLVHATGAAYSSDSLYAGVIDAQATKGENGEILDTLIVTPAQLALLRKAEKNAFVPMSQTNIGFDTYAGFKIVVSNRVADLAKAGEQSVILAGRGLVSFAETSGPKDMEIERIANGGNGQGGDILHTRRNVILHPQGAAWKGGISSGTNKATLKTELEKAANWQLVAPAEQVAVSFIKFTVA